MTPDPYPRIITTFEPTEKNHFPLLLQLGVLVLILVGIFGALFFTSGQTQLVNEQLPGPVPNSIVTADSVPQKIAEVQITGAAGYVWDVKGQRALYTKNHEQELPLASITKLMTALLAYELIEQDQPATVSVNAIRQEGSFGLSVGEQFDIQQLTQLALIESSNDAAYELAASV